MFTLISRMINFFFEEKHSDNLSAPLSSDCIDETDYSAVEFPWLITNTGSNALRSIQGRVTHMFENHGLIDGEVYFSVSDVHSDDKLQIGDKVLVKAAQHHKDGGWQAEDICVIKNTWELEKTQEPDEIDLDILQSKVVIGKVTHLQGGVGRIDADVAFSVDDCKDDYVPVKGDWVSANVVEDDVEKIQKDEWDDPGNVKVRRAYNVCPARVRNFEGFVSCFITNHGYISGDVNGDTFFSQSSCLNGYRPKKNDSVKVTAIESSQGKCEWRAVSVVPLSSVSEAYRSKQFQQISKPGSWLIPGQRPKNFSQKVILPVKLPHFMVPDNLLSSMLDGTELTDIVPELSQDLSFVNYSRRMSSLLYLEEIQMQMDIREFDMDRVCLNTVGEFLSLTVPGLAEGRPSILIGDQIILSNPEDPEGPRYIGFVHELTATEVQLKFSPEFHSRYGGQDYNVQFTFSRTPLRRCHQAVSLAVQLLGSSVLFPDDIVLKKPQVILEALSCTEQTQADASDSSNNCNFVTQSNVNPTVQPDNRAVQSDNRAVQSDNRAVQSDNRAVQSDNRAVQSDNRAVQSDNRAVQSDNRAVQSDNRAVQSDNRAVQSDNRAVQLDNQVVQLDIQVVQPDNEVVQPDNPAVQADNQVVQPDNQAVQPDNQAVQPDNQAVQPDNPVVQAESPVVKYTTQDVRSKRQPDQVPECALESSEESRLFNRSKRNSRTSQMGRHQGFINPQLNGRQKSAVERILLGQARPTPYVIFGPPGTGKTITVVEAILQVLHKIPSSRILACTPSNSAADLIADRLHSSGLVTETQMVRLNAFQRYTDSIPESILKYCRFSEDMQMISRFRVIVSTCSMAGSLYGLGLSAGHVTHVFVDECGQATEPECLIPVGLVSGADGQAVLAGDPKQLGPILMSPFAKMYGLELTFLERLMTRKPYLRNMDLFADNGGYDPLVVTMLVENYRSHPSILALSSRLFYFDQLEPKADPGLTHKLAMWQQLPMPNFPVVFHGIRGDDIREATSPSWFNPGETVQVVRYLQGVLKEGVNPDHVGIITPYRKQVEKIRLMVEHLLLPEVKVGSVEEFQGQERQVIIISTVRSNEKLINFDVRHCLGFLSNPKRFNVALTRAQALLIIVGNPFVLRQDPNWKLLIRYCVDNGGYTGCELPDRLVGGCHEERRSSSH